MTKTTVPELLRRAAATYEERNKVYGDNYKEVGKVLEAMFPGGAVLRNAEDWNRICVFLHCLNKLTRYAQNMHNGGHYDSALDLAVYAAMLTELTEE